MVSLSRGLVQRTNIRRRREATIIHALEKISEVEVVDLAENVELHYDSEDDTLSLLVRAPTDILKEINRRSDVGLPIDIRVNEDMPYTFFLQFGRGNFVEPGEESVIGRMQGVNFYLKDDVLYFRIDARVPAIGLVNIINDFSGPIARIALGATLERGKVVLTYKRKKKDPDPAYQ